jgi:hypothetical protein
LLDVIHAVVANIEITDFFAVRRTNWHVAVVACSHGFVVAANYDATFDLSLGHK